MNRCGYGQHDAPWIAFYRVFKGLVEAVDRLEGLTALCRTSSWWWPFAGAVILTERPVALHRRGLRLHCETGPALAYRDGFVLWRIGGVIVDEQIVLAPETQTLEQITGESNEERKRVRIERYGPHRYLSAIGAEVIDGRRNDAEATLESLMRARDGLTYLVCACPSTGRVYHLEVPPGTSTCEAAQHYLSRGLSRRIIHAA